MSDQEIIAANLDSARRHLAHALCNQGIDWDEACDECEAIERRWRAVAPFNNDECMATKLRDVAYPYEDM
jgi:hypothetical protein